MPEEQQKLLNLAHKTLESLTSTEGKTSCIKQLFQVLIPRVSNYIDSDPVPEARDAFSKFIMGTTNSGFLEPYTGLLHSCLLSSENLKDSISLCLRQLRDDSHRNTLEKIFTICLTI